MTNFYAKKLEKIFNKVDKLANKGRDNKLEYTKYIDDLINKGDYSAFQEMLLIFYEIDTYNMRDIAEVKSKTWDEICFQTKATFLTKLSKLYKKKGVYQQSYNIYTDNVDTLQLSLSDKLSSTYSILGITSSIDIQRNGDMIDLYVYDNDITTVQIQKADWITDSTGKEVPSSIRFFQDLQISYIANSFTTFNPSQINVGDTFTVSLTTTKQFIPDQVISITYSNNFIEGTILSYDRYSGDAVLDITNATGSQTHSLWVATYLSGPKNPTFSTNIPSTQGGSYLITTTQKNNITFDFENYAYKLIGEKTPLIGQIYETEIYTPDTKYLLQNKDYAKLIGQRRVFLEAVKVGATYSVIFDFENPALSDDANLINRYTEALNYLLS